MLNLTVQKDQSPQQIQSVRQEHQPLLHLVADKRHIVIYVRPDRGAALVS